MRLLTLFLSVALVSAANIHTHGVEQPCEVYPVQNPTTISFSNGIVFDTRSAEPALPEEFVYKDNFNTDYYMIQFTGPVYSEWVDELKAEGMRVMTYIPHYALVVKASAEQLSRARTRPFVQWTGIFHPAYKVQKEVMDAKGSGRVTIQVFPVENPMAISHQIQALGYEIIDIIDHELCKTIEADIDLDRVAEIARIPGVLWIQLSTEPDFVNNNVQWVVMTGWRSSVPSNPGARRPWFQGVVGQGAVLSSTDSGIMTAHYQFYDSAYPITAPGVYPNHRKLLAYKLYQGATFPDHAGYGYHGTHVNGTIAGNDTTYGSSQYDGMSKWAHLYFVDIANSSQLVVPQNLTAMYDTIYLGRGLGFNILQQSGSWGWGNTSGTYLIQDASTDAYVYAHEDLLNLYAAGNESSSYRIRNPGISKNIITVGATRNSTSSNQIASFSSRGPTQDQRIKPNLMAPGDGIVSANGGSLPNGYTSMSGTSMATPAANGAVGLIRQYLLAGYYPTGAANPPDSILTQSAALLRAMAYVSCDPNVSSYTVPDFNIGWGRIDVDSVLYFTGDTRRLIIHDDWTGVGTGTSIVDSFQVMSNIPLRVCVAWTDTAAAPSANPTLINDLHAELVAPGGTYYRGNQYSGGQSQANPGSWDTRNVEECFRINSPAIGVWYLTVSGNSVPYAPQGYAWAITGDVNVINVGVAEQNAPLPVHSEVTFTNTLVQNKLVFDVELNRQAFVNARIYDLTGRVIDVISEGIMAAGMNHVEHRVSLANGVYFVAVDVAGNNYVEKIMIVR